MQQVPPPTSVRSEALLQIITELARELKRGRRAPVVALDTRLDRDLGFDSLARMELILRVQQAFGVALPDSVLGTAETPRDLLHALSMLGPTGRAPMPAAPYVEAREVVERLPVDAATLLEVLDWHTEMHPERSHLVIVRDEGDGFSDQTLTYAALRTGGEHFAAGLQALDVQPGENVAIMLPTGADYFFAFLGILMAGAVPVPLYPPLRASQLEDHLQRHAAILSNCQAKLIITFAEARAAAQLLKARVPGLRRVVGVDELSAQPTGFVRARHAAGDLALLQYTSGSTGSPKGVMLTHANLLANIRCMGRAVHANSQDVFVSWLPLYHDMGLIGAWLGSLYFAGRFVVMSPLAFLSRPSRWLRMLHTHRATLSAAPNFAYELCARRVDDREIEGLDLSSVRLLFNGAEPVAADTIEAFTGRFAAYGLTPVAVTPVYGLAECCVGLTFPPIRRGALVDRIDRGTFMREGRAVPALEADSQALRVVACGLPMPEHDTRIVDDSGHEVADRVEGRLQFQGPSATQGYYRNPDATRDLLRGDWRDSGDLAYAVGGEIYVTGRVKDIIIRAGRHIHPQDIEESVGAIDHVRRGCVAVFGGAASTRGTERLIVLAETRLQDDGALEQLRTAIQDRIVALIGEPADEVLLAPPHSVPKTSSGKLRRRAARELYERGMVGHEHAGPTWQAVHFALASALPLLRRVWRSGTSVAYAAYAWLAFGSIGMLALLGILTLPGVGARREFCQALARALVSLTRIALSVQGRENLDPTHPCVVVSNHASYADALVLVAAFPHGVRYAFLAKRELARHRILRSALERTGTILIERADVERSVRDAQSLAERLHADDALVVFAEGTLRHGAGLMPFHLGGFVAAAESGVPVVPVAIRGTRNVLRGDQWFPRRAPVTVTIGAPITPPTGNGRPFDAALALRDAARRHILAHCGELDLSQ